ncbi:acetyl-CoA carboxylase carboxyltransferase subunit beta [Candidatus Nesciobacter abundans]|uniref:Acetyl-coenzyme A carboxylase carboxyl transferase subunit beta n=1 Tax=Candidatus Nesciobacter abundans TaxID=2601668 RepID=A0A5C0UG79_9PROT|nr:acetyl-CoA carboxylase carboxyltransferase subunit beta [Candidatus Nesciobacter abundans]QEK39105.1 acetyl-CoA carboxylase carboxyl transferase subunit beta [Candidatus Nesciobacter abundans]
MNWFTDWVKPKLKNKALKESDSNLWIKCTGCEKMIFREKYEKFLSVCPECGFHGRLSALGRIKHTLDEGFELIEFKASKKDPISFYDVSSYIEKIKKAQSRTGLEDACLVARGKILGRECIVLAMDFAFIGGSMGTFVGNSIFGACEMAEENNLPFITFSSSGGARMQEGLFALMQMPRSVLAIKSLKNAKLPYISVMCDPTTGGVEASFSMLGSINISEPKATIGFAGIRVIKETINQELPKGFQKSEFQFKHGYLDQIIERSKMKDELSKVLRILN